ncbi:abortive infection system antitoxin AbiGi family protein [Xenorhabdus bovienii]|uniref:abortive infection system antitoxin AbiGi family protein n=1 Tax=Xenorhabdus bovienii TaxID=40576 RepID=UPI003DA1F57B
MIIHFTNKFEKLFSIISSNSFSLHYCGEYFGDKAGKIVSRAAHPMVSFSDYNHNELQSKPITYGGYGIALCKEWAVKNGLSPVNYIDKNSPVAQGLIALLRSRQLGTLPKHLRLPVIQLKCFTKHVYGYNSYFGDDNFDFKCENEWRFVPTIKQIGGNRISVNFSKYKKQKSVYDKRIESYSLKFSSDNIKYIYVQSESEREQLISAFGLPKNQIVIATWHNSIKSKVV